MEMPQKVTDKDKAIKSYTAAVKQFNQKKYEEAKVSFENIIDKMGHVSDVRSKSGDYVRMCERILGGDQFTPRTKEDRYSLALYHYNNAEYEEAENLLKTAIKSSKDPYGLYLMSLILFGMDENEEAYKHLTQAIEADPSMKILAVNCSDLSEIHKTPEFMELIAEQGNNS
jgi:tetratricopeptide (TPR) repeat protein